MGGFSRDMGRLLSRAQVAVDEKVSRAQVAVDGKVSRVRVASGGKPGRRPGQRPVLIAAASILALAAVLLVFAWVSMSRDGRASGGGDPLRAGNFSAGRSIIPPEELFLPDEPDFVPGVLLGRERRPEWGSGDAELWWRNPLAGGEEQWRARIERIADEIMESVP